MYPGVRVWRVPPLRSAIVCSAFWCSRIPPTVTMPSSRDESISSGVATAAGAPASMATTLAAQTARCVRRISPPDFRPGSPHAGRPFNDPSTHIRRSTHSSTRVDKSVLAVVGVGGVQHLVVQLLCWLTSPSAVNQHLSLVPDSLAARPVATRCSLSAPGHPPGISLAFADCERVRDQADRRAARHRARRLCVFHTGPPRPAGGLPAGRDLPSGTPL